jgi:hypothetical protein
MAKPIADVDVLEVYNEKPYVVTVRVRNVWRLQAALTVLYWAVLVARLFGVGVRVSVSGR